MWVGVGGRGLSPIHTPQNQAATDLPASCHCPESFGDPIAREDGGETAGVWSPDCCGESGGKGVPGRAGLPMAGGVGVPGEMAEPAGL